MRQIILIFCIAGLWSIHTNAQTSTTIKSMDAKKKGSQQNHRIWYGGNVPFGLGFGNQTLIQFGLSPMVGYKITPELSVGPRAGFLYTYYSQRLFNGQVQKVQPFTWAAGVFARYKVMNKFFAHAEYEYQNLAVPFFNSANMLDVQRFNVYNMNLGIGLLQGGSGSVRSEILVLYNINPSPYTLQSPLTLRFGLNWHF